MNFFKSVFSSNLVVLAAGVLIFVFSAPVHATTFYVNTSKDSLDDDGDCSLREAIISANTDGNYNDDCGTESGLDADTIELQNPGYCLSLKNATPTTDEDAAATGDLDILDDLTIQGGGQEFTFIDAGAGDNSDTTEVCSTLGDRIFEIAAGTTVNIIGLTIEGGSGVSDGGGIYVSNSSDALDTVLNLQKITIDNNSSLVNGGGLYGNTSTITLTDSTVSNNSITTDGSGYGGGIYAYSSTLTLKNSTVSGNVITSGIGAYGAGIRALEGDDSDTITTLINSTVSGNRAEGANDSYGGGIYRQKGTINLLGSTVSGNRAEGANVSYGGGLYLSSSGTLKSKNSIFSGNQLNETSVNTSGPNCYGTLESYGHNFIALVSEIDNCTITEIENSGTDITTKTHDELAMNLLADNGGETQTRALTLSSPALNKGACKSFFDLDDDGDTDVDDRLTTDQRGQTRTNPCDIGAYEYSATDTCGDGIQTGSETCDDGNMTAGDGCSDVCVSETATDGTSDSGETCGDGTQTGSETCDDGNTTAGDGCSDVCVSETATDGDDTSVSVDTTDTDGDGITDADESSATSSTSSSGGGCAMEATQATQNPYALLLTLILGLGALALPRFGKKIKCYKPSYFSRFERE